MTSHVSVLESYDRTAYNRLPEHEEAEENLQDAYEKLPKLGEVICEHDLHDTLGVVLLHKHFSLNEDEQMVKQFDLEENEAYLYPSETDERNRGYLYQVNDSDEEIRYEPLEFFAPSEETDDYPTLSEATEGKEAFLEEFAEKADEIGLSDTFGLVVHHQDLLLSADEGQDEIPLEETDHDKRVMRVTVESPEELDPDESNETLWVFDPAIDETEGVRSTEPDQACCVRPSQACCVRPSQACCVRPSLLETIPLEVIPVDVLEQHIDLDPE